MTLQVCDAKIISNPTKYLRITTYCKMRCSLVNRSLFKKKQKTKTAKLSSVFSQETNRKCGMSLLGQEPPSTVGNPGFPFLLVTFVHA